MFGGLLKSTSLAALVAVAGIAAAGSANAADLGGNCCADLEERIAELEATTARKGNRKVSLTISGQVNTGVLIFDDGVETNAYVVDNTFSSSRFRFLGSAKIDANWKAGYLLELEAPVASSSSVTQANDEGSAAAVNIRHSVWYLENTQLGRISVGQTSTATDDIILADSSGIGVAITSDLLAGNSLNFRTAAGALTNLSVNTVTGGGWDSPRSNVVRYDSPTMAGFRLSATWGEDDQWDVGLWYANKLGDFKVVGGIGYFESTDTGQGSASATVLVDGQTFTDLKGSISAIHEPTGLFGSFAFVEREFDGPSAGGLLANDPRRNGISWYYGNAGISLAKLLPAGKTVLVGEYGEGDGVGSSATAVGGGIAGNITDANLTMWGLGFVQHIPAAEMEVFASYRNFDLDASVGAAKVNLDQIDVVFTGARIKF